MKADFSKNSRFWQLALALSMLLVFGELAYLSVARYRGYNAAMNDLGNMSQAIWSATQGEPLVFTHTEGAWSRLSLHVELAYFLLAPLYALIPSPVTLLVVQSLLFVLGALPLYLLSTRHLEHRGLAFIIACIYLLYPVAHTAVLFDFHGDTLAMPLLLFSLEALDRCAWRSYAFWLVLSLACKFYVSVPVAALGLMLIAQRRRRVGLFTAVGAVVWGIIAYAVIRPMFAPPGDPLQQVTALGYVSFYFGEFFSTLALSWPARVASALIVFLPVLPVIRRATWWLLPALAVAVPSLISSGPGPSHYYGYHHYALVVPFAMAGLVFGIEVMRQRRVAVRYHGASVLLWPVALGLCAILTVTLSSYFVDTGLNPRFWRSVDGALRNPFLYARTSRDRMKDRWLTESVPARSALAASRFLAPHVVNRETLYVTDYYREHAGDVDYVVTDALFDYTQILSSDSFAGGVSHEWPVIAWTLKQPDFALTTMRDGLLLFERSSGAVQVLVQTAEALPAGFDSESIVAFGSDIRLLDYEVELSSPWVLHFTWCWQAIRSLQNDPPKFAVSRLDGVLDARFVHLPTAVLLPSPTWDQESKVCEYFDVSLPEEVPPGEYNLLVGWYETDNPFAFATDERSRVGEEYLVDVISLP